MAKSLHTLIRLHQHLVDEKRRELGGMLAVVSDLERQAGALEEKIMKEQDIAKSSPDLAGVLYGNFAATRTSQTVHVSIPNSACTTDSSPTRIRPPVIINLRNILTISK